MNLFSQRTGHCRCIGLFLALVLCGLMILPVSAADATIEAELGDTLTLHGVLYTGDRVYLFMTGPGLPENGVTLTDVSQRADQGKFTMVDVDSEQKWSMRWNTARIENEIDPGTYLVYVTNEPVDKANLGGAGSYKTLEVFFTKSTTSRVSVSGGNSYTLNPEMHTSYPAPALNLTTPSPTPTTPPTIPPTTVATLPPTPVPTTTKTPLSPVPVLSGILIAGLVLTGRLR